MSKAYSRPAKTRAACQNGAAAGLSAARELARFGFAVTVFEAKEQAGGLDTDGIGIVSLAAAHLALGSRAGEEAGRRHWDSIRKQGY